jgi:ABC-type multidrug transport system fused ATPase/permease subunit
MDEVNLNYQTLILNSKYLLKNIKATASVDFKTDRLIQEVVRREFFSSTVISIAHRVDTVMACDRVVVMNAGRIDEVGRPQDLMKRSDGRFRILANDHGYH